MLSSRGFIGRLGQIKGDLPEEQARQYEEHCME